VLLGHIRQRLLVTGAAIALTLTLGTAGFIIIERYPVFDAFYMTLITISTVGYMEIHPLSHAGRVFNSFLIFFGVTTLFFAIGAMTQTIIELELGDFFGKRRIKNMVDKLNDHFIVCGFGRVGRGAAHELKRSGARFLVTDKDQERVERAMRAEMLAVLGDCTRDETLIEAGIKRARGMICALETDSDNLFLLLSAKSLNNKLFVAARVAEEDSEEKFRRAGADAILAPYQTAGARLAQAILRPHVAQFLDLATMNMGLNVTIEQLAVTDGCEFVSKSLRDIQLRRELGVIVLAIRNPSGQMRFNPPAEAVIEAGDNLIVMGETGQLQTLERLLAGARG
jgi:voltage-gated potassium channel